MLLPLLCFIVVLSDNPNYDYHRFTYKEFSSRSDSTFMWKGKPISKKNLKDSIYFQTKKFNDSLLSNRNKSITSK